MATRRDEQPEVVLWARRVNGRWIVHHGLKESAEAYLDRLEGSDPERLVRSCERARRLVRECEPGEDPKPWFYAGLFSLATAQEVTQFLERHWFTASSLPSVDFGSSMPIEAQAVGPDTLAKLERLRDAVAKLARHD
jgi:hypothetical protein